MEIRKSKREECFWKKRTILPDYVLESQEDPNDDIILEYEKMIFHEEHLAFLVNCMISENIQDKHKGVIGLKKILQRPGNNGYKVLNNVNYIGDCLFEMMQIFVHKLN